MIEIRLYCRNYRAKEISYNNMLDLAIKHQIVIIDVRSEQEYSEGHINGAINIPLYCIKNKIGNYAKRKDECIVVYCSAGIRSKRAQEILNKQGYCNVYNLIL